MTPLGLDMCNEVLKESLWLRSLVHKSLPLKLTQEFNPIEPAIGLTGKCIICCLHLWLCLHG